VLDQYSSAFPKILGRDGFHLPSALPSQCVAFWPPARRGRGEGSLSERPPFRRNFSAGEVAPGKVARAKPTPGFYIVRSPPLISSDAPVI
jgi:hypothetical protein